MNQGYSDFEISQMRQRYYELKEKIKYYTSLIDDNNYYIRKNDEKINELDKTKSNLRKTEDRFRGYIENQVRRLECLKSSYSNTRFAVQCSDEMIKSFKGSSTNNAGNSIVNAINDVNREINKVTDTIDELKHKNSSYNNKIIELKYEKKLIYQKGVI